jgi:hypothetical protein
VPCFISIGAIKLKVVLSAVAVPLKVIISSATVQVIPL